MSKRYIWLTASLVLLFFLPADWLELQRQSVIEFGELWRLVTAHWSHVSLEHLALNAFGLLVLGNLFPSRDPCHIWLISLVIIALSVSLALLALLPTLSWYRGFSGCLYGLFVYEASRHSRSQPWTAAIVLLVVVAKLAADSLWPGNHGTATFIGAPVVDSAHIAGASTGFTLALVRLYSRPAS